MGPECLGVSGEANLVVSQPVMVRANAIRLDQQRKSMLQLGHDPRLNMHEFWVEVTQA